ncbi:hypothetical protein [Streptomyces sp. NPDC006996]
MSDRSTVRVKRGVFGLDEKTAMRYADSAPALLEQAAEQTRESRQ